MGTGLFGTGLFNGTGMMGLGFGPDLSDSLGFTNAIDPKFTKGGTTQAMNNMSSLGNTGMALAGAGSLYSGIKGTEAAENAQALNEQAYYDAKLRQDEEDAKRAALNF